MHQDHFVMIALQLADLGYQPMPERRVDQDAATELEHHARHFSPVPSSNPYETLAFCKAWLAAPFRRLSIAETTIACPLCSSTARPKSQNGVSATNLIS